MRKLLIIGIGTGDPDHLTLQAIKAINRAQVFFIPDKGAEKHALRDIRKEICARFIEIKTYRIIDVAMPVRAKPAGDYHATVDDWHAAIAATYADLFARELADDGIGAFLVWGDPALYDSTIRIIEAIRARGVALDYEVIPGISSIQVLAARHRIPLNGIGEPVLVTTGRKLAQGFPKEADNVVVMLDGTQTFTRLTEDSLDIFWGAYLGTAEEILVSGPLSEVAGTIESAREDARRRNGWIMDTYLLRRSGEP